MFAREARINRPPVPQTVTLQPEVPPRTIVLPQLQTAPCSQCHGSGVEAAVDMSSPVPGTKPCSRCNGNGYFTVY